MLFLLLFRRFRTVRLVSLRNPNGAVAVAAAVDLSRETGPRGVIFGGDDDAPHHYHELRAPDDETGEGEGGRQRLFT